MQGVLVLYDVLVDIIGEQRQWFENIRNIFPRMVDIEDKLNNREIFAILGVRRCGKSYLLYWIGKKIGRCAFVDFEDPRFLEFRPSDFENLLKAVYSVYGDVDVFLFDEIQNVAGWEKFVRKLYARGNKVILTGSNAKLLSGELSTALTGRYNKLVMFPFSFREVVFMSFKKRVFYSAKEKAKILRLFNDYLKYGGFPQVVLYKNYEILNEIIDGIIYRDVVVRFGIESLRYLEEIILYLVRNVGKEISYNRIAKTLGIRSVNTVKKYILALEKAYLLFMLPMYSESPRRQIMSDKKVYFVDSGLRNRMLISRELDRGNLLENVVFLELARRVNKVFYFKDRENKHECDFVYANGSNRFNAVQVTYELNDQNRDREVKGLLKAMEYFGLREGLLLTYDQEEEITVNNRRIIVKPVWKWLIE